MRATTPTQMALALRQPRAMTTDGCQVFSAGGCKMKAAVSQLELSLRGQLEKVHVRARPCVRPCVCARARWRAPQRARMCIFAHLCVYASRPSKQ